MKTFSLELARKSERAELACRSSLPISSFRHTAKRRDVYCSSRAALPMSFSATYSAEFFLRGRSRMKQSKRIVVASLKKSGQSRSTVDVHIERSSSRFFLLSHGIVNYGLQGQRFSMLDSFEFDDAVLLPANHSIKKKFTRFCFPKFFFALHLQRIRGQIL